MLVWLLLVLAVVLLLMLMLLLLWCPPRTVEAKVREHSTGVAGVTPIHWGHRGHGHRRLGISRVVWVALVTRGLCLDPRLLLGVKQLVEVLDVAHGVTQDLDLGHLLHGRHGGDVLPEDVESLVEILHPVSLSLVSLDCLQTFCGFYFISVNWMEDVLGSGRHGGLCSLFAGQNMTERGETDRRAL